MAGPPAEGNTEKLICLEMVRGKLASMTICSERLCALYLNKVTKSNCYVVDSVYSVLFFTVI